MTVNMMKVLDVMGHCFINLLVHCVNQYYKIYLGILVKNEILSTWPQLMSQIQSRGIVVPEKGSILMRQVLTIVGLINKLV